MSRPFYTSLRDAIAAGESPLLATIIEDVRHERTVSAEKAFLRDGEIHAQNPELLPLWERIFAACAVHSLPCVQEIDGLRLLFERMCARPKLAICGGGHIAVPLCRVCGLLDFDVTVLDDRPEFADPARFPEAERVICAPFAEGMERLSYGDGDYFVIITRGHKDDRLCLTRILQDRFAYAGMIGSRSKVAVVMQQLRTEGWSAQTLARVHAPIGLRIGAQTPAEIAVCIAAELVQVRSGLSGGTLAPEALEVLSSGGQVVLATIVGKDGSAPRGLGAKLLADASGLLSGTVGGGAGEAEVLAQVPDTLAAGVARLVRCNMTNADARADGMVCGGTIDVLIEPLL